MCKHITEVNYKTDALRIIANNVAQAFGGSVIETRYADLFETSKSDNTAESVIARIKKKIQGLKEE